MNIFQLLFYFIIIIPSAIVHEVAHGLAALWLGDDTAKRAGRLTLNPIAHIDLWGTILLPVFLLIFTKGAFIFAYAKPVPYNPYNLKTGLDELKVSLAGPAANFLLAAVFAAIARLIYLSPTVGGMAYFFSLIVMANIALAVFNLLPIPPLDGSKLLYLFIPKENLVLRQWLNQYGIIILLAMLFIGFDFIQPVISFLNQLFLGPVYYSLTGGLWHGAGFVISYKKF